MDIYDPIGKALGLEPLDIQSEYEIIESTKEELFKIRSAKLSSENKNPLQNKPIVTCPHCFKVGDIGNMKQWHFDKCKSYGYEDQDWI